MEHVSLSIDHDRGAILGGCCTIPMNLKGTVMHFNGLFTSSSSTLVVSLELPAPDGSYEPIQTLRGSTALSRQDKQTSHQC